MSKTGLETFQEMKISPNNIELNSIRISLLEVQSNDWTHGKEQESKLKHMGLESENEDILIFVYEGNTFPKSALTLWQRDSYYRVSNIVPAEINQLDMRQYNLLLRDFESNVINKSKVKADFEVFLSDSFRGIDSWTDIKTAQALSGFSNLANKNTRNTHPSDHLRWEKFVILAHQSQGDLPADILMRWLVEVDGWDETSADRLSIDFENGISLLQLYDTHSRD